MREHPRGFVTHDEIRTRQSPVCKLDYLNRRTGLDGIRPIYVVPVMRNARSHAVISIHLVS
jgi:hypothetical protein